MHIAYAPFRLKDGITEDQLMAASDRFDTEFVRHQAGVVRRVLLKDGEGGYVDLVSFEDLAAIERTLAAEQSDELVGDLMSLLEHGPTQVYEVVKVYEHADG